MSEKPCGAYFFAFFEKFVAPILTSGGYVGLSIATLLSQHHKVTAVDIVPEKVELINNKKSPIQDEYIEKYLAEKELDLTATLDAKEAYSAKTAVTVLVIVAVSYVQYTCSPDVYNRLMQVWNSYIVFVVGHYMGEYVKEGKVFPTVLTAVTLLFYPIRA